MKKLLVVSLVVNVLLVGAMVLGALTLHGLGQRIAKVEDRAAVQGPSGPHGPAGPEGPEGPPGPAGADGQDGGMCPYGGLPVRVPVVTSVDTLDGRIFASTQDVTVCR